ncbi:Sua5/YciO/YrdC/YwlC family protein, partial [Helicobacter pylori]|nr:Sua5/YciO/YrdC/YwlC family protein [Helicobacter pylori]
SPFYGVILPYTPLHALLLDLLDFPIVFTSAKGFRGRFFKSRNLSMV